MSNEKYLVVISGPSGCGKDTVFSELKRLEPEIEVSVSCTTREMREHEADGVDYYFLTREQFEERIKSGRMLEYTEYSDNLYGTPRDEIEQRMADGKTVVLIIEVCGGAAVKRIYPGALLIFIKPPSIWELRRRLLTRKTEDRAEIRDRLRIARRELKKAADYDFTVVNDDVGECARHIQKIIKDWQA